MPEFISIVCIAAVSGAVGGFITHVLYHYLFHRGD